MWGESHFHTSALPLMLPTSAEERDEGWGGAVEPSHAHILPTRTIVFSPCPFPPPSPPSQQHAAHLVIRRRLPQCTLQHLEAGQRSRIRACPRRRCRGSGSSITIGCGAGSAAAAAARGARGLCGHVAGTDGRRRGEIRLRAAPSLLRGRIQTPLLLLRRGSRARPPRPRRGGGGEDRRLGRGGSRAGQLIQLLLCSAEGNLCKDRGNQQRREVGARP